MPEMSYDRLVQSLYMQALMQLGGATANGQPPQVDILGARQTIDMLSVLAEKTKGNLTDAEDQLIAIALFELRMGFLEVTQAIARQPPPNGRRPRRPPRPTGPSIVPLTHASNPHLPRQRHLHGRPHARLRLRRLHRRHLAPETRATAAPGPRIRLAYNHRTVLIDTGPDFHAQAIRENIRTRRRRALHPRPRRPRPRHGRPPPPHLRRRRRTSPSTPTTPPPTSSSASSSTPSARSTATPPAPASHIHRLDPHARRRRSTSSAPLHAHPRHPRPRHHHRLPLRPRRLPHRHERHPRREHSAPRRPRHPHPRRPAPSSRTPATRTSRNLQPSSNS